MKKNTRRDFLKIASLAPVVLIGCGRPEDPLVIDSGRSDDFGKSSPDVGNQTDEGFEVQRDTSADSNIADVGADVLDAEGGDVAVDMAADECELTGSDVEGPFHLDGAPSRTVLADANEPGSRLVIEGTVVDENCVPVAGAMLDVWHADTNGDYHGGAEYRLRGQMVTDEMGAYQFETIKPGRYPLGNSTRPAHIHFIVSRPGFVPLTTQLYFEGDPFLKPNDPCGDGCNSGDSTLIVPLLPDVGGGESGTFQIVLSR